MFRQVTGKHTRGLLECLFPLVRLAQSFVDQAQVTVGRIKIRIQGYCLLEQFNRLTITIRTMVYSPQDPKGNVIIRIQLDCSEPRCYRFINGLLIEVRKRQRCVRFRKRWVICQSF